MNARVIPEIPKCLDIGYVEKHYAQANTNDELMIGLDYETIEPLSMNLNENDMIVLSGKKDVSRKAFAKYIISVFADKKFGKTEPLPLPQNSMVRIADSLQNAHVNAFAGISFADRNVYFAEKSIAERSALPIPHSPVCVSNLLHMFAMSASCGETVSVIAPTMLPHRHMLLL